MAFFFFKDGPRPVTHTYTSVMARGWESKSVEDQISQWQAEAFASKTKTLSPLEMKKHARRQCLLLARTRTITALETSRDAGYREMLEGALRDLDSELSGL